MNIALEIVSDTILFGGYSKYRDIPVNDVLFVGQDKAAWTWIKNYAEKHGEPPVERIFRENFPEASYRLQPDGAFKDNTALADIALQKLNAYGVADTITKAIGFHDSGNIDQATAVMRDYLAAVDKQATGTFRVVSADGLEDLPDPEFLVENLVQAGTVNQLTGYWGTGKSFLALDWALCVATGKDWFGKQVQAGNVVYVAAEGGAGLKKRVRSWKNRYGYDSITGLTVVLQPVQLADSAQLAELVNLVKKTSATMVVIDTQAQCTIGLEENSTQAMGVFIKGLYALRDAVTDEGTTVMVVHHTGYEKTRGRGSSSVAAAMDGIINVECPGGNSPRPDECMTLDHQKAKDFAKHEDIFLKLEGLGASQVIAENEPVEFDREAGTERIDLQNFADTDEGITSNDVQQHFGWNQTKANRMLKSAVSEKKLVVLPETRGRATVYQLASHVTSSHD